MNGTAGCILLENPKSKCVQGCHQVTWALPQGPSFFAKQCDGCLLQCCFHDTGVYCGVLLLRLEYFSDIPRTSSRTPDVQLHAIDATLCIIGHLAPNLGFCYNSNISLISCGHLTLRNGHSIFALSDNSRPTWPSGPMVSLFVTIQIFL